MKDNFDVVVVGAGIIGLAAALAAVEKGKRVAIVERSTRAVGASIRNFGFITVTGQKAGEHYARAMRSRDIWARVAQEASIDIHHHGLVMPAYREEAAEVVHAFLKTDMGTSCRLMTRDEAANRVPALKLGDAREILYSPHELRVESADAIPKLAAWLAQKHGVTFYWSTAVHAVDGHRVETSRGTLRGDAIVVCPGDDLSTLFPGRIAQYGLQICTLQMLRVDAGNTRLGAAIMSDLSLARYEGFNDLPEARALASRLDAERAASREAGIHLITVQSADGSLVVGDSHIYGNAQEPFALTRIDDLMLEEFDRLFDLPQRKVVNRWVGTYASSNERTVIVDAPMEHVRLAMVTGGTGASTGFALGEQVIDSLYA